MTCDGVFAPKVTLLVSRFKLAYCFLEALARDSGKERVELAGIEGVVRTDATAKVEAEGPNGVNGFRDVARMEAASQKERSEKRVPLEVPFLVGAAIVRGS